MTLFEFRIEDHMELDEGNAYIGIIATTGVPEVTNGPTTLRSWSASFPQSCEEVYWEKTYLPFNLDGYDGDKFDHRITGTFLQPGDIIQESLEHVWDDIGYVRKTSTISKMAQKAIGESSKISGTAQSAYGVADMTRLCLTENSIATA